MKENIQVSVVRGDQQALEENIEAETKGKSNILIYEDVFEKLYPESPLEALAQTISHEFWHIFSARYKFYHRLEKVYSGNLVIQKLTQKDVMDFVDRLNSLSEKEVNEIIKGFRSIVSCWTDEYIREQARYDSKKKFFKRIEHFELRGLVEEMFAEKYAEIISGVRNEMVPWVFGQMLKRMFKS